MLASAPRTLRIKILIRVNYIVALANILLPSQSLALGLTLIAAPQLAVHVSYPGSIELAPDYYRHLEKHESHASPFYSSRDGFARKRLSCARRDFSSSVRFFALRDLRVGTRFGGR